MSIISALMLTVLFFSTIAAFKVKKGSLLESERVLLKRDQKGRFMPIDGVEEEFITYTSLRRDLGLET